MKILALDAGKTTGWAVVRHHDLHPDAPDTDCGSHHFEGCDDLGHLAHEFTRWLGGMLDLVSPDTLAMERPFGRPGFTADMPIVLVGIAHGLAHARGIQRVEFGPSTLKARVAGTGKAKKADVIAAVRLLGFEPDTDHAADAAACALVASGYQAEPVAAPARGPR